MELAILSGAERAEIKIDLEPLKVNLFLQVKKEQI
jgi:hypothetical protein